MSLSPRQFGRIRLRYEHGFKIIHDELKVDTVMDVNSLFFQLSENRLGDGMKPAFEVIYGLANRLKCLLQVPHWYFWMYPGKFEM